MVVFETEEAATGASKMIPATIPHGFGVA